MRHLFELSIDGNARLFVSTAHKRNGPILYSSCERTVFFFSKLFMDNFESGCALSNDYLSNWCNIMMTLVFFKL
jgi:hypothetical protein